MNEIYMPDENRQLSKNIEFNLVQAKTEKDYLNKNDPSLASITPAKQSPYFKSSNSNLHRSNSSSSISNISDTSMNNNDEFKSNENLNVNDEHLLNNTNENDNENEHDNGADFNNHSLMSNNDEGYLSKNDKLNEYNLFFDNLMNEESTNNNNNNNANSTRSQDNVNSKNQADNEKQNESSSTSNRPNGNYFFCICCRLKFNNNLEFIKHCKHDLNESSSSVNSSMSHYHHNFKLSKEQENFIYNDMIISKKIDSSQADNDDEKSSSKSDSDSLFKNKIAVFLMEKYMKLNFLNQYSQDLLVANEETGQCLEKLNKEKKFKSNKSNKATSKRTSKKFKKDNNGLDEDYEEEFDDYNMENDDLSEDDYSDEDEFYDDYDDSYDLNKFSLLFIDFSIIRLNRIVSMLKDSYMSSSLKSKSSSSDLNENQYDDLNRPVFESNSNNKNVNNDSSNNNSNKRKSNPNSNLFGMDKNPFDLFRKNDNTFDPSLIMQSFNTLLKHQQQLSNEQKLNLLSSNPLFSCLPKNSSSPIRNSFKSSENDKLTDSIISSMTKTSNDLSNSNKSPKTTVSSTSNNLKPAQSQTVAQQPSNATAQSTSTSSMHSRNACKKLKCPKCNWHYKYHETLDIHMREKHSMDLNSSQTQQCIYCLENTPHPRLGRGEQYKCGYKPYRCDICDYSTTTKGNLSIHMQSDKHINNIKEGRDASSTNGNTNGANIKVEVDLVNKASTPNSPSITSISKKTELNKPSNSNLASDSISSIGKFLFFRFRIFK